jgi:hypothetical protein
MAAGGAFAESLALVIILSIAHFLVFLRVNGAGFAVPRPLEPPIAVLAALYAYAVVQELINVRNSWALLAVTLYMFASKLLLYLLVCWVIETNILTFYMHKVRELVDTDLDERKAFLESIRRSGGAGVTALPK